MSALSIFLKQLALDPKEWPLRPQPGHPRPDDLHFWPQLVKLARRWRISITQVETTNFVGDYQWDGTTIVAGRGDNLVHDIAHYQCAHPDRRFLKDFGLGSGPDSFESPPRVVSDEEAEFEESCASLLGILWEIRLGMPFKHTMSYHHWDLEPRNADLQIKFLKKHRLIRAGNPVAALRKS